MSALEIRQLWSRADSAGNTQAALSLLQEAERLAAGQEDLLFETWLKLAWVANFVAQPEVSLLNFTKCLQAFDRNPNFGSREFDVLWRYKFILHSLAAFPQISLARIEDREADFESRMQKAGYSMRAVRYLQSKVAVRCGQIEEARALNRKWPRLKRDRMGDCAACEANSSVHFHYSIGDWEGCLTKAKSILSGRLSCIEVPGATYAYLARACHHLGDPDKARYYAAECLRLTHEKPSFLAVSASLIGTHFLMTDYPQALGILERRLSWLEKSHDDEERYLFMANGAVLLRTLLRRDPDLSLRIPENFLQTMQIQDASGASVERWLQTEADRLGQAFTLRNGNSFWVDHMRELEADGANRAD